MNISPENKKKLVEAGTAAAKVFAVAIALGIAQAAAEAVIESIFFQEEEMPELPPAIEALE